MSSQRNVCTIPPGVAFLDTLVSSLLDGRLVPGFDPAADPFALTTVTIYLPTRRAVRAIRENFLARLAPAVLLPKIRPIGDIDEDGLTFEVDQQPADFDTLLPPVDAVERQLFLTRLILGWSNALERRQAGLPEEGQLVPSSPADAARLAGRLADLIDAVATGEADWSALEEIVPAELAGYWDITLQFLKIATDAWPGHLAERGLSDPGERRDTLIRMEAERLSRHGSPHPVIAAGSTGSIVATADLLRAVSQLPNGAVVLPGLDLDLDAGAWTAIGAGVADPVLAGHPQFGLARLVAALGMERADVRPLTVAPPWLAARSRLVSEAMRPAESTHLWSSSPPPDSARIAALDGVGLVDARNEREEALAIAVILRRSLEQDDKVAALVTPDRNLARRVIAELERWQIRVDDSAGIPLAATRLGVLARLTAETALGGARADRLLALVKHPAVALAREPVDIRRSARALERAILRGPRLRPGFAALRQALLERRGAAPEASETVRRASNAAAGLDADAWAEAIDLAGRLEEALQPLAELHDAAGEVGLAALLDAHWRCLQALCRGAGGDAGALASDDAAESLLRRFAELVASAEFGPPMMAADYPAFLEAMLGSSPVRPKGADPRIHVWGTLEARLQSVDLVVLGSLNEGVWPHQASLDPFLSRGMRQSLRLEPPERRIGLAAHDFAQAFGQERVWLTRAARQDGEPRVASRWLQRLTAYAGSEAAALMRSRGDDILALAGQIDEAGAPAAPAGRPCPAPPVALRPGSLPVTAIEDLIRDPYAVYARHVLRLKPFEPIAGLPGPAERGSLFHSVLERFVSERPAGPYDAAAGRRLIEIGREEFARYDEFPDVAALWWPRFRAAADWFVQTEAERQDEILQRLTEVSGSLRVTRDLILTGRADRIDMLRDGRLAIVDYKTGAPPSGKEVLSLAPQLLLEALIAERNGFAGVAAAEISEIAYYHLKGSGDGGTKMVRGVQRAGGGRREVSLDQAKRRTWDRLLELAVFHADPSNGYLSRKYPRPTGEYRGEYDHLARVAEWSLEAEE